MDCKLIYITLANRDDAVAMARRLLEKRLVACANILDGVTSLYWWKDQICEDREAVMIAKTRADLVSSVIDQVKAAHNYECPCVVSLPIEQGNTDFLEWIIINTSFGK